MIPLQRLINICRKRKSGANNTPQRFIDSELRHDAWSTTGMAAGGQLSVAHLMSTRPLMIVAIVCTLV